MEIIVVELCLVCVIIQILFGKTKKSYQQLRFPNLFSAEFMRRH